MNLRLLQQRPPLCLHRPQRLQRGPQLQPRQLPRLHRLLLLHQSLLVGLQVPPLPLLLQSPSQRLQSTLQRLSLPLLAPLPPGRAAGPARRRPRTWLDPRRSAAASCCRRRVRYCWIRREVSRGTVAQEQGCAWLCCSARDWA